MPQEWVEGIPHRGGPASASGEDWQVLRAWHSKKMHYLAKLAAEFKEERSQKVLVAFPDLSPASGGVNPLAV